MSVILPFSFSFRALQVVFVLSHFLFLFEIIFYQEMKVKSVNQNAYIANIN